MTPPGQFREKNRKSDWAAVAVALFALVVSVRACSIASQANSFAMETESKTAKAAADRHLDEAFDLMTSGSAGDPNPFSKVRMGPPSPEKRRQLFLANRRIRDALLEAKEYARVYEIRGLYHTEMGMIDEADSDYSQAIELEPENARYLSRLGILKALSGEQEEGLQLLNKAVSKDPDSELARLNLGAWWMQIGDYEKAISEFELVLKRSPGHPIAVMRLVSCYTAANRTDDASYLLEHLELPLE